MHEYDDVLVLNSTGGAKVQYGFRTNGMYDPDYTGTGHQPMYFDQLSAIYDHYMVIRSTIDYEFLVNSVIWNVAVHVDDDTSWPSTVTEAAEQPTGLLKLCSPTSTFPTKYHRTWDAKKYFGGDIYDNINLQGTPGADPTEQSFYVLTVRPADNSSSASFVVKVKIRYTAVWFELKSQTQS